MYSRLARIEKQLAGIELEYLRKSYLATRTKFRERATAIREIPDFWSTVFDEAPTEIDQRIQPRDVPALSCLTGVDIERFEIVDADCGEPRSVKITFHFKPNQWFHDETIEKVFYWRMSAQGWSGLVSEPVAIRWKQRDLTEGLLDMVMELWQKEKELETASADPEDVKATSEYKALISKIESTPQDAISIFGLFAFRGHKISAEESAEAMRREERMVEGESEYQDLGGHSPKLPDTEIYPHGEEVVVALSEDMYPGATAYFTTAKERDAQVSDEEPMSDSDTHDSESEESNSDHSREPPSKKARTSS